ncbi:MAG: hypothetical protein ACI8RZ_000662 [Myxococcota bacterium]|jgi:hypothetical protein
MVNDEVLKKTNPKTIISWVSLAKGQITASGAPGKKKIAQWAADGVTDVVTLQRGDEHAPWLPAACESAGLRWHHLPLSGRRLERRQDRITLAAIPDLLEVLREDPPRKMIVHCSAGLHRTGVCLYILLRAAGQSTEDAVTTIAAARPLTAEELCRVGKNGVLRDIAEAIYQGHSPSGPP